MQHIAAERVSWKKALKTESPLLLPVAHDALTARIIEQAGFHAVQIGGFAVEGARHGVPDVDLTHYAEESAGTRDIMEASSLPVMVDADDGYGDVKNVTHAVRSYIGLGIQGLFIEDQQAPKECGHMEDKKVVPVEQMAAKVKAAVAARQDREFFILARTDALQPEGIDAAIRRAEKYLKAGADGVYVEGPTSESDLKKIGKAFQGEPLATSVLENGGKTPWLPPDQFADMGFTMILYPTTLLFRAARAIDEGVRALGAATPTEPGRGMSMEEFMEVIDLQGWTLFEERVNDQ